MTLARQITVLEAVAAAGRPLSAAELEVATGVPRPTCYRMVQALTAHGLLRLPGVSNVSVRQSGELEVLERGDPLRRMLPVSRTRRCSENFCLAAYALH